MFQVAILKMEALSKPLEVESASILCVAVWRNQPGTSVWSFSRGTSIDGIAHLVKLKCGALFWTE